MARALFLTIFAALCGSHAGLAQYDWVAYEGNPVIDFSFDQTSSYMFRPAVLKRDSTYHMWYGKQTGLTNRSIGYATSPDGISWTLKKLFAIAPSGELGTFDEVYATNATVVDEGDTLKMWYSGSGNVEALRRGAIGYAWSTDGANWTKVKGPGAGGSVFDPSMDPVSLYGISHPTVVKVDGVYHMWYAKALASDQKSRIGYARSTDGISWTAISGSGVGQSVLDVGLVGQFDADQAWWPWVIYNEEKGLFEMWYQGIDDPFFGGVPRLGCAKSTDGIVWEKVQGSGDALSCLNSVAQPGVILDNGIYRMWYALTTDVSASYYDSIRYATSSSTSTAAEHEELPNSLSLMAAYPNPFDEQLTVVFDGGASTNLRLEVRDLLGRLIHEEDLGGFTPGTHAFEWSASGDAPSGSYLIRLTDGEQATPYRMVQRVR